MPGTTAPDEVMPGAEPFAFPGEDGPDGRTGVRAFDLVVEAGDSRAAMMALAGVGEQRRAMARRTRLALDLAVDDDCDVLLASLGA